MEITSSLYRFGAISQKLVNTESWFKKQIPDEWECGLGFTQTDLRSQKPVSVDP